MSNLFVSAVKRHALHCAKINRNGKFTRVGQDFFDELEAEVEAIVRALTTVGNGGTLPLLPTSEDFIAPDLRERLLSELNAAVARLIQNKIQRQPSVGQTAGRTR